MQERLHLTCNSSAASNAIGDQMTSSVARLSRVKQLNVQMLLTTAVRCFRIPSQAQQLLDQPDIAALRDKVLIEAVARTLGAPLKQLQSASYLYVFAGLHCQGYRAQGYG